MPPSRTLRFVIFMQGRKRKGCQALQALWRGHHVRRRWRPIIRLRIRHGRRAFMRPCFHSWSRLTRVHKWARSRFKEMEGRWTRSCFDAWAGWTADLAAEKLQKLERAARTLKNVAAYRVFRSWKDHTRGARRARKRFARVIGGPTLDAWIRYTDEARVDRKQSNAAVVIQQHARGYLVGQERAFMVCCLCVHRANPWVVATDLVAFEGQKGVIRVLSWTTWVAALKRAGQG